MGLVAEVGLGAVAEEVLDEGQGGSLVLGAGEQADASDVDQCAGFAGIRVGVGRREVRVLVQEAEQVVVVDQPDVDFAIADCLHLRGVLGELLHLVVDHGAQPLRRGLVAVDLPHRRDKGLEGPVGRRPADATPPLRLGQVEDGGRDIIRSEALR